MTNPQAEQAAQQLEAAAEALKQLLPAKARAYGAAHTLQRGLWRVLLSQYREPDTDHYRVPVALFDHVPRLTRVFDRVCRIVANPANDLGGEDPWMDMAGDAIAGMAMPKGEPRAEPDPTPRSHPCTSVGPSGLSCRGEVGHAGQHVAFNPNRGTSEAWGDAQAAPCVEPRCQRHAGHDGPHRRVHSGGVRAWETGHRPTDEVLVGHDDWAPGAEGFDVNAE